MTDQQTEILKRFFVDALLEEIENRIKNQNSYDKGQTHSGTGVLQDSSAVRKSQKAPVFHHAGTKNSHGAL